MYKLRICKKRDNKENIVEFNLICKPNVPDFYTSLFISNKSKNSKKYGQKTANKLIRFLNFLFENKVDYWNANDEHIQSFFLKLINFDTKSNNIVETPKISYPVLIDYKNVIIGFYKFLWQFTNHSVIKIGNWKDNKYLEKEYPLLLKWQNAEKLTNATLELFMTKYKTSDKEYIKEYTEEEITAIYSCFKNYRNRAIFLITLHGMRIDEVLSIKLKDYNPQNNTVKPSRSKGKGSSKKRTVVLDDMVIQCIENYIFHERNVFEIKSNEYVDYLFISMQMTDKIYKINPYSYSAYRNSFITASKNAGLKNVRTHSGRSHRASELLSLMQDGKVKLTDEIIRHIMGWKCVDSITPYVEHANEKISIKFSKDFSNEINEKLNKLRSELDGKK